MMRRGFSIIEVILAVAIGSIVVAAAISLMAALDRTDARLERRYEQRMELARTRTTMQRVMTSLVMDDTPQSQADDAETPASPRFSLAESPSPGAQRLFRRARLAGVDLGDPQRLEVVVSRPPAASPSLLSMRLASQTSDDDRSWLDVDETDATHRGAFELWPDDTIPGSREAEQAWPSTSGMTLWWVPVREDAPTPGTLPDGAVPLASGLVSCRWQVFRDSERQSFYDANWVVDLPGYVEFEARTNADIQVSWMFEIMWTEGPEQEEEDDAELDDEDRGAGGDGGGSAGSGGSGGSPSAGASAGRNARRIGGGSTGGSDR